MSSGWFFIVLTIHLLAAMVWVGGLAFFVLVGVPLAKARPDLNLAPQLGRKFRPVGWGAIFVLLVTGPVLLAGLGITVSTLVKESFWLSAFGMTLLGKILLIIGVIALTIWHDFLLGPRAERGDVRAGIRWVARAIALGSLAIVVAGVGLVLGY